MGQSVLIADVTLMARKADVPIEALPESELVARLRRRDEAAFSSLVGRFHTQLTRLARSFVRDHATAEEVAQDTWLAVVSGIDRFAGHGSLKAWIFSILVNRARSRASRDGRSISFSGLPPEEMGELADAALFDAKGYWKQDPKPWQALSPVAIALSTEFAARLTDAIEKLPPRQRAVVTMRDLDQLSSEDVCNALGVSETNQRVLLHRARMQLRAALEPYLAPERKNEPC